MSRVRIGDPRYGLAHLDRKTGCPIERVSKPVQGGEGKLQGAIRTARALVAVPTIPVSASVDTSALRAVWARWNSLPDDHDEIPDHLLAVHEELVRELTKVSEQAGSLYSEREERWKEVSPNLMAWVAKAREAVKSRQAVDDVKMPKLR